MPVQIAKVFILDLTPQKLQDYTVIKSQSQIRTVKEIKDVNYKMQSA